MRTRLALIALLILVACEADRAPDEAPAEAPAPAPVPVATPIDTSEFDARIARVERSLDRAAKAIEAMTRRRVVVEVRVTALPADDEPDPPAAKPQPPKQKPNPQPVAERGLRDLVGQLQPFDEPKSDDWDSLVRVVRVPHRGLLPQVVATAGGAVHMAFFHPQSKTKKGLRGDVYYARRPNRGTTFGHLKRLNTNKGQALLAPDAGQLLHLKKGGYDRLHIAWVDGARAPEIRYARTKEDWRGGLEAPRAVLPAKAGQAGVRLVTRDAGVAFAWGGGRKDGKLALHASVSSDEGRNFVERSMGLDEKGEPIGAPEVRLDPDGRLVMVVRYRKDGREHTVVRTMENDQPAPLDAPRKGGAPLLFTKNGEVYEVDMESGRRRQVRKQPATRHFLSPLNFSERTKQHLIAARDTVGRTLVAWIERYREDLQGTLYWQVYDHGQRKIGPLQQRKDVPAWSRPTIRVRSGGRFVLYY